MVESGAGDNDYGEAIDWRQLLDNCPDNLDMFGLPFDSEFSNSSPDSLTFSIGEMEQLLIADDNAAGDAPVETAADEISDDFFADVLLDLPIDGGNNSNQSSSEQSDRSVDVVDLTDGTKNSDSPSSSDEKGQDMVDVISEKEVDGKSDGGGDDPISKKQRRQLRNRDAAVRSRERKKMYVRDLELKSRYLEGECRRLGMLLQWCSAENQALRLSLQNAKVVDVSRTRQESAVLFLESLLLGSLLWFLCINCLLNLPQLVLLNNLGKVLAENAEVVKKQESLAPKEPRSKMTGQHQLFQSFMMGKTCKASRSRMKPTSVFPEVLV